MLLATKVVACSLVSCVDRGIELRHDFTVMVKHDGKPLPRVRVQVTTATEKSEVRFSGVTADDGKLRISGLAPGDYWFGAELLGIGAAYYCFHVAERPSIRGKHKVVHNWGDYAPSYGKIAGILIDSQPGTGESPIWNLIHRVDVPIGGAKLSLQNAVTGETFNPTSDRNGAFAFGVASKGTYVLHIEGGDTGRAYDPTNLPIKLSTGAAQSAIVLARQEGGGGSCGGTSLTLR
jgi:hypothetical protein